MLVDDDDDMICYILDDIYLVLSESHNCFSAL